MRRRASEVGSCANVTFKMRSIKMKKRLLHGLHTLPITLEGSDVGSSPSAYRVISSGGSKVSSDDPRNPRAKRLSNRQECVAEHDIAVAYLASADPFCGADRLPLILSAIMSAMWSYASTVEVAVWNFIRALCASEALVIKTMGCVRP
jgi:hypothetical protein